MFTQLFVFSFLCMSSLVLLLNAEFKNFVCAMKPVMAVNTEHHEVPFLHESNIIVNGTIIAWEGETIESTSPIVDQSSGQRIKLGKMAKMKEDTILRIVDSAKLAWRSGRGKWPQMTANQRISAIQALVEALKKKRTEIINTLMWEICKTREDATAEFDRTMTFIEALTEAYRAINSESSWTTVSGIMGLIRRAAIGIVLCLGPFNYPFNETYAALIPALLMGNIVIMKIPSVGGLAHMLTLEAFASTLPPGVISFVSGSGRSTIGPIMRSGFVDIFAFIGSSSAADAIIKQHPAPHRLKLFLQLEGKNLGIVLPDADLSVAVEQITLGATSYNGQRCTAIKLIFIHSSLVDSFMPLLVERFATLKEGFPWEAGVSITPLAEEDKPAYLQELLDDAVAKGAKVVNEHRGGGSLAGALMTPAIVFPVTSAMRLWTEEQFGPVVPVAVYDNINEVYDYISDMRYGLQAAVFTKDSEQAGEIIDILSTAVGRINVNTQCARSPDTFPFSSRRSSGMGTMSVTESLRAFSTETVIATKKTIGNEELISTLSSHSNYLNTCKD